MNSSQLLNVHLPFYLFVYFFLKKRNLSFKTDLDVGFGDFSYDKFFKYFELLSQHCDNELSGLQRQLEQLEAEKSLIQVRYKNVFTKLLTIN